MPYTGYWHSAPDSARMHRCPQPSACGNPEDPERWPLLLRTQQDVNSSSSSSPVQSDVPSSSPTSDSSSSRSSGVPSTTAGGSTSASGSAFSYAALLVQALTNNNTRTQALGLCQSLSYYPQQYGSSAPDDLLEWTALEELQCNEWSVGSLNGSNFTSGSQAAGSFAGYLSAECGEGYAGNLCAACQPGYYGNAEFECK
jgi:hypothetical protein